MQRYVIGTDGVLLAHGAEVSPPQGSPWLLVDVAGNLLDDAALERLKAGAPGQWSNVLGLVVGEAPPPPATDEEVAAAQIAAQAIRDQEQATKLASVQQLLGKIREGQAHLEVLLAEPVSEDPKVAAQDYAAILGLEEMLATQRGRLPDPLPEGAKA